MAQIRLAKGALGQQEKRPALRILFRHSVLGWQCLPPRERVWSEVGNTSLEKLLPEPHVLWRDPGDPGEPTWCGSWVGKPHHTDCVLCLVEKIVWPNWLFVPNAPHVFEHVNKLWQGSRMRLGVTGHWVMLWALGIHNGYHVTNSDVGALLRTQTSEFVTWLLDYTYMGQFLQDGKNVCLTALFFKVERSGGRTW